MTDTPAALLTNASAGVRRAVQEASNPSVAGFELCQQWLAEATANMLDVQSRVPGMHIADQKELRLSLEAFRQEVERATRLMDSGAAFCRAIAGVSGANYDSAGHPAEEQCLPKGIQA